MSRRFVFVLSAVAAVACSLEPLWRGDDTAPFHVADLQPGHVLRVEGELTWAVPEVVGERGGAPRA